MKPFGLLLCLSLAAPAAARAQKADPKNAQALVLRAGNSNKLKDYKGAIDDSDAALALDPRNAAALVERGFARLQLGDVPAAQADIEAGLALDPGSGRCHLYLGYVLEKLGKYYEAAEEAQKAFWLDAALKPLADELLARTGGGKRALEFGPEAQPGGRARTFALLLAVTLAVLFFAGRFVSFDRGSH